MYDLIIIGGGPAAVGAGVYAARKKLKTLLVTESFGGQSITSDSIENWIGEKSINGFDLAKKLEEHVRAQSSLEIKMPERVTAVREIPCVGDPAAGSAKRSCDFETETNTGGRYQSKAVIVTSGSRRRRLGVLGEEKFEGKGVAFCSTCDAPIFAGKRVAVVGGGNAGLEAVVDLFPYAAEIYLLHRGGDLKGDPVTQEEIKANSKVSVILNAEAQEILGDQFVTGLAYKETKMGEIKKLDVDGVFVEIGAVPNSEIVKGMVELNPYGEIVIDHRTSQTSKTGVFAAGDVTDELYKQNNISVGDGITAALSAYNYILGLKKQTVAAEKPNGSTI
ncbi:MAG: FAD-dependent oxidoreductase [Candidatus Sungbacteria bacterium]|uniref:FAD-dependent oxidoreductase n=1 Tax=Candidatus Sungiibacteriota bacterium TaxID=2750080 RepID=A0A932YY95_9BACT|nr:FAD-dependent oxidoreductase [Candidatus Sungbacteria bacterium]